MTQTFECHACAKQSRFKIQANVMRLDESTWHEMEDETRTFVCEHCGSENTITQSILEWRELFEPT